MELAIRNKLSFFVFKGNLLSNEVAECSLFVAGLGEIT